MKHFLLVFILFPLVLFVSTHFSLQLPYVENWPYTGTAYGLGFSMILALLLSADKNYLHTVKSGNTRLSFVYIFSLLFLLFTIFWCFTVRQGTERLISYSFENAVVINKARSSNHNYPRLELETVDGKVIKLDIPGQDEIWENLKIGDRVSKEFRREEISLEFHHEYFELMCIKDWSSRGTAHRKPWGRRILRRNPQHKYSSPTQSDSNVQITCCYIPYFDE